MQSDGIHRRTLFRGATLGLGGLYLAPFLRDLAADASLPRPPRVLFFVQGNGVYPADIQPEGIERQNKPDQLEDIPLSGHSMSTSLQPLEPWVNRMTIIHGLSGFIARGSHNSGFAALGCWPFSKKDFGETIDAALARKLDGIYRHVGIGVSNRAGSLAYNVTSAGRGKALPTILNPVLAHKQFFAAGASGAARKAFDVDTNLLDFLADDVSRMQTRLHGDEKAKLERYLNAFESMSKRQGKLANMADRISAADPKIDPSVGKIIESKTAPTGVFDRLEAQFQIAAGMLIAGLTNVVTVTAGAGPDRIGLSCMASEVGKGKGFIPSHAIGHGSSAAGMTSSECHAMIRRTCLQKLAGFIRALEAVPEGDGTMLDNTLIVYMSDSAEGHHPRCQEWPFVLIGDLGGRLKLGNRYLRFPWYGTTGHRTIANLYTSLLHAVGEKVSRFGLPDSKLLDLDQDGPLTEIMA